MPTLQTRAGAGPAVADVLGPSAIAAAKHTNAQAKARELIILLVNLVFILSLSVWVFVVLAFRDFSLLRTHFWPFIPSSPDYAEKVSGFFATDGITGRKQPDCLRKTIGN
jgi:hypothetical protein